MKLNAVLFHEFLGPFFVEIENQSTPCKSQLVATFHCAKEEFRLFVGLKREEMKAMCAINVEFQKIDELLSLHNSVRPVHRSGMIRIKMMLERALALMNLFSNGIPQMTEALEASSRAIALHFDEAARQDTGGDIEIE